RAALVVLGCPAVTGAAGSAFATAATAGPATTRRSELAITGFSGTRARRPATISPAAIALPCASCAAWLRTLWWRSGNPCRARPRTDARAHCPGLFAGGGYALPPCVLPH